MLRLSWVSQSLLIPETINFETYYTRRIYEVKLHKKQLGSALSLFLTLSILLSMLALPAMAKAPAEGATLTLDDTLLTLDQSEETFVATLKVPVSQEQKNWADNQWKDWADSIQWSLTRDKVDVQSPEYYPNIYTGDDLEIG